jgi:NADPH-dependent curcumin reductase CurA
MAGAKLSGGKAKVLLCGKGHTSTEKYWKVDTKHPMGQVEVSENVHKPCVNPYQDNVYGTNMRVHIQNAKGEWRCSCCGALSQHKEEEKK